MRRVVPPLVVLMGCALVLRAVAAPEEIQVYDDEMTVPGHYGLDLHLNDAVSGHENGDYLGARPTAGVLRVTPEFYRGLTESLELGVYLMGARTVDGQATVDGAKVRLKYLAPHAEEGGYWGLNVEVGRSQLTVAPAPWNTEIKAIAGWHSGPWRVAANVNVDTALSANGGPATVEVTSRLARDIGHDIALGVEAYDTLGRISRPGPLNYFEQSVYLTADVPAPGFDLHVGVGRGLTSAADPWVVKAILGFKFGAEH